MARYLAESALRAGDVVARDAQYDVLNVRWSGAELLHHLSDHVAVVRRRERGAAENEASDGAVQRRRCRVYEYVGAPGADDIRAEIGGCRVEPVLD